MQKAVAISGPFVYRLGREIFILKRGVRLSYGLPIKNKKDFRNNDGKP